MGFFREKDWRLFKIGEVFVITKTKFPSKEEIASIKILKYWV